jgi:hypothetical protein
VVENDVTDSGTFDQWIVPYEQVSDRIAVLDQEFEKQLDEFDQYRHGGLGERLRKAANEIIEGKYEDEEEYEEELARPAGESADASQTPLAPTASGDATHAEDTSTTGQLSPGGVASPDDTCFRRRESRLRRLSAQAGAYSPWRESAPSLSVASSIQHQERR